MKKKIITEITINNFCLVFLADCGLPANVSNAEHLLYNSTLFMSGVRYECVEGFTLIGQPMITCQDNSVWTSAMFMCVGEYIIK